MSSESFRFDTEKLTNINQIKNELLTYLKENEKNLTNIFNKKLSILEVNNTSLFSTSNKLVNENKLILENFVGIQDKLNKIENLEINSKKNSDTLISHEIRITNNSSDLIASINKYDKIISDNLFIPGFIGQSCKFKSIPACLKNIVYEIAKLKNEKDIIKNDAKDTKNKLELLIKSNSSIMENTFGRCKNYIDLKFKDFKSIIDNKINEILNKITELRIKFCEFKLKSEEQFNEIKNEIKEEIKTNEDFFNENSKGKKRNKSKFNKKDVDNFLKKKFDIIDKDISIIKTKIEKKYSYVNQNSSQDNLIYEIEKIKNSLNDLEYKIENMIIFNNEQKAENSGNFINKNNFSESQLLTKKTCINNSNNFFNDNSNIKNTKIYNCKSSNNLINKTENKNEKTIVKIKMEESNKNIKKRMYGQILENNLKNLKTIESSNKNTNIQHKIMNDNFNNVSIHSKFILFDNDKHNHNNINNNLNESLDDIPLKENEDSKKIFNIENNDTAVLKRTKSKSESKFNKNSTVKYNYIKSNIADNITSFKTLPSNSQKKMNLQKFNKTNSYNLFSPINNKKYDKKNEFEENKVRNNIYFNNSMNEDSTGVLFSNNKNNNIDKSKKKLYLNTLAESPEINLKDEIKNNKKLETAYNSVNNKNKAISKILNNKSNNNLNMLLSSITSPDKYINRDEKIMKEFFIKNNFNKNKLKFNLLNIKNKPKIDLYNYSVSSPENYDINKNDLSSFTDRLNPKFIKTINEYMLNKRYVMSDKTVKYKNKIKAESMDDLKNKTKSKKNNSTFTEFPTKISPTFSIDSYLEYEKNGDFINRYFKNE